MQVTRAKVLPNVCLPYQSKCDRSGCKQICLVTLIVIVACPLMLCCGEEAGLDSFALKNDESVDMKSLKESLHEVDMRGDGTPLIELSEAHKSICGDIHADTDQN